MRDVVAAPMMRELRASVGMVFQELHLFPHLTVLDNITLALRDDVLAVMRLLGARGHDHARRHARHRTDI